MRDASVASIICVILVYGGYDVRVPRRLHLDSIVIRVGDTIDLGLAVRIMKCTVSLLIRKTAHSYLRASRLWGQCLRPRSVRGWHALPSRFFDRSCSVLLA